MSLQPHNQGYFRSLPPERPERRRKVNAVLSELNVEVSHPGSVRIAAAVNAVARKRRRFSSLSAARSSRAQTLIGGDDVGLMTLLLRDGRNDLRFAFHVGQQLFTS